MFYDKDLIEKNMVVVSSGLSLFMWALNGFDIWHAQSIEDAISNYIKLHDWCRQGLVHIQTIIYEDCWNVRIQLHITVFLNDVRMQIMIQYDLLNYIVSAECYCFHHCLRIGWRLWLMRHTVGIQFIITSLEFIGSNILGSCLQALDAPNKPHELSSKFGAVLEESGYPEGSHVVGCFLTTGHLCQDFTYYGGQLESVACGQVKINLEQDWIAYQTIYTSFTNDSLKSSIGKL